MLQLKCTAKTGEKTMKKVLACLVVCLLLLIGGSALADLTLPENLSAIDAEAFMNDASVTGVQTVPAGVTAIGKDAFSGTGLYALIIEGEGVSVGAQKLNDAAYVQVRGSKTMLSGLTGVRCVIAPAGSLAAACAQEMGIDLITADKLVTAGGFIYRKEGEGLRLMFAQDAGKVGASVTIPTQVNGVPVTAVAATAFMRCTSLKEISLPDTLEESVPEGLFSDCAGAEVTYYGSGAIKVDSVESTATAGDDGTSVTWNVTVSGAAAKSYLYVLTRDGEVIDTQTSSEASYTYPTGEPGAYQLSVEVTDALGNVSKAVSGTLYIAVEAMVMTVPETLNAGEDLVISVDEVEGATGYSLRITEEATGTAVSTLTLTEAKETTVKGYLLEPGVYRVTGYVYGHDFRYAVPTTRLVTVTGEKAAGPVLPEYEPLVFGMGAFEPPVFEEYDSVLRYWYEYGTGETTTKFVHSLRAGENVYLGLHGDEQDWAQGGYMYLQVSLCKNGVWTAWGEVRKVEVLAYPRLDMPEVTAPATVEAGTDFTIAVGDVENARFYMVSIFPGYDPDADENDYDWESCVFDESRNSAGTYTVPGYVLDAGVYTLLVEVGAEEYGNAQYTSCLEVVGERSEAPVITASKTEMYVNDDSMTLSISAPGAEGAVILRDVYGERTHYGNSSNTASLDVNGQGTYNVTTYYSSDDSALKMYLTVAVIRDGKWSQCAKLTIPLKQREALQQAVINAPATLVAGADLSFTFDTVENADSYSASIRRSYSENSFYSWDSSEAKPGTVLTLAGHYLTQGNYYITVNAKSEAFGSSTVEVPLTITGTRPAPGAITPDRDEVFIKDTLVFTMDTTGVEKVCIDYDGSKEGGSGSYGNTMERTAAGDVTTWDFDFREDQVGYTFTFRFSMKKDGVWSAWKTFEYTVQDLPALAEPVIHMQDTYPAGADIEIGYETVENATSYSYQLRDEEGHGRGGSSTEGSTAFFNGYDMEAGVYTFELTVSAADYKSTMVTRTLEIVGQKPAAVKASADKTDVAKSETFTIEIDTTGAEALRYKERYNITSSGAYTSDGSITVLDDVTKWSTSESTSGLHEYSFSALIDGLWTEWSEPVKVTVADSSLPKPTMTVPGSISLGQDLTVTVNAVEGASSYYVYLYNSRGAQVMYKYLSAAGDVTIEGYRMAQGSYSVKVTANGSSGSSTASKSVYVNYGTRPAAPAVTPETDLGRVGVRYKFDVASTGAEQIAVRYYRDGNTNSVTYTNFAAAGDVTSWQDYKNTAGEVWNYAFAVKVDGVWSAWSSNSRVTITSREQLKQVNLTVPESVEAGEDVAISFTGVANADSYRMYLYYPNGNSDYWTAYPGIERLLNGYSLTNGTYRVSVVASGAEYDSSTTEKTFVVSGDWAKAPSATVDVNEVFTEETFTFVIDTTDAEAIMYRYDRGSGYSTGKLNALSDRTVWETELWSGGLYQFSFCVCRDGKWTAWSTPIQINVLERPALAAPEFTVPESINQGANLTVNVTGVDGADYYYVYLYNNRGQSIASSYLSSEGDAVFNGYRLPVGSLTVEVSAYSSIGGYSKANKSLTVVSAAQPAAPAVTAPESAASGEYFTFTIGTEGAEKVVARYYRIGSPNDLNYSVFNASGSATTDWRQNRYNSGESYGYSFAVCVDGVWSQWSTFAEVTIE